MTIDELKRDYKRFYETFIFLFGVGPKELAEKHLRFEAITENEYNEFIKWIEDYSTKRHFRNFARFENYERRDRKEPFFIIKKECDYICPICGGKVYRRLEYEIPRFPIYHYYCEKCSYITTSRLYFKNYPNENLPTWVTPKVQEFTEKYASKYYKIKGEE